MNRNGSKPWLVIMAACLLVLCSFSTAVVAQESGNETEPNDDRRNATQIDEGTFVEGRVNASDDDWLAFDARAGHMIRVTSQIGVEGANVRLYGPDGTVLGNGTTGGPVNTVEIGTVAPETGTYSLRVSNGGRYDAQYGVKVATAAPDRFEPNDDREGSVRVESGESYGVNLFEGGDDWFAVQADAGENVTVTAELTDTGSEIFQSIRVELYGPDGNRVGEVGANPAVEEPSNRTYGTAVGYQPIARQHHVVNESGTYYVRVVPVDSEQFTGFVDYELAVNTSGATGGEPINTIKIKGTGAVVDYTFEATTVSPGELADVEDDTDQIDGSVVRSQTGENGIDTYYFTGKIRRFTSENPGTLVVWINGEQVEPTSLGDGESATTATTTPTPTATPTATATPTPTATAAPTATPTATATETGTPTSTQTATPAPTTEQTPTVEASATTDSNGRIVGGTATETSASGPGFGGVVTLVSLLVAGLFAARQ